MMRRLVNAARGETSIALNGEPQRLCLTLGALAEIETALDVQDGDLSSRLKRLSARDMLIVLLALLRGGGASVAWEDVACADITAAEAAEAVAQAFEAAVGDEV